MTPTANVKRIKKTKPSEFLTRFIFGGVVTACAGLVTHYFGPTVGGLFLAFPAILPASLTLVERHSGREQAVEDAEGACLGAIGLAAFALATWHFARIFDSPAVLGFALIAWLTVSIAAWWFAYGRESPSPRRRVWRRPYVQSR